MTSVCQVDFSQIPYNLLEKFAFFKYGSLGKSFSVFCLLKNCTFNVDIGNCRRVYFVVLDCPIRQMGLWLVFCLPFQWSQNYTEARSGKVQDTVPEITCNDNAQELKGTLLLPLTPSFTHFPLIKWAITCTVHFFSVKWTA